MASSTGHLLDTNILVYLLRWNAAGQTIDAHFGLRGALNRCVISIVTVGEMYSLVRQWAWGPKKTTELRRLLGQVVTVDVNHPAILEAYGELDDASNRAGRSMGKNDVWIAATAKAAGATLLTTDGDFCHLCPIHLTRIRIDSKTGNPLP
jgi:predicted nucleic acid-binding protein